jgi:hypothetical protein
MFWVPDSYFSIEEWKQSELLLYKKPRIAYGFFGLCVVVVFVFFMLWQLNARPLWLYGPLFIAALTVMMIGYMMFSCCIYIVKNGRGQSKITLSWGKHETV